MFKDTNKLPYSFSYSIISILIVLAGLSVFVYYIFRFSSFTMDDAYITYRYASNFANGNGLVFNPGEEVKAEGLTSPLWAVILSICTISGADMITVSKVLGVLSTLITSLLIFLSVKYLIKLLVPYNKDKYIKASSAANLIPSIAVFIYLIDPYAAGNSVSGMETSFAVMIFSLFLFFLFKPSSGNFKISKTVLLCFLALAACLLRPELIVSIMTVFLLYIFLLRENRKSIFYAFIGFILLGTAYFLFRYNYYGTFFPLPFYVKRINPAVEQGLFTILRFLLTWIGALPLLIIFFIWTLRNSQFRILLFLSVVVLVQFIYWLFPTQIMGFGYRYFQQFVPILVVFAAFGLTLLYNLFYKKIKNSITVIVLVIILISPIAIYRYTQFYWANDLYITWYARGMVKMENIGKTLKDLDYSPVPSIAVHDCGAIPYYSGWRTIDLAGLNDLNIAVNLSPEGVMSELSSRRPEVVMIGSRDPNKYVTLFPNEVLFNEQYNTLGYKYLGTAETFQDYYYRFYTSDTTLFSMLKDSLTKNCSLYETSE